MKDCGLTIYRRSTRLMNRWLDWAACASAGPHPSIRGMRKLFWGKGANIVKCGVYIYRLKPGIDPFCVPQL